MVNAAYDPWAVLNAIEQHKVAVFALLGGALICNYIWYVEAVRVARRDRAYCIPLACTYVWLAHDASLVASYDKWFNKYDHWFMQMLWFGLVVTTVFEAYFIVLTIRYGHAELFPTLDRRAFIAAVLAGQVAVTAAWIVLKDMLGDELFLYSLGLAVVWYAPFGMAMAIRRGGRRGQTVKMWISYLGGTLGYFTASLWFGPYFRSWRWLTLGAVSVAWVLATACFIARSAALAALSDETATRAG